MRGKTRILRDDAAAVFLEQSQNLGLALLYSVTQMPIKSILGVPSLEFALSNLCFAKKKRPILVWQLLAKLSQCIFI